MAKVLRLHDGGNNTINGWSSSAKYTSKIIESIVDPNSLETTKPITSIPSPFARLELLTSAFSYVAQTDNSGRYPNMDKNTIYNKMVSDSLDVGQIFFHMDELSEDFEVIAWDKDTDLVALQNSTTLGHKSLAQTYNLFLTRDGARYNLDKMKRMYLLNYKKGTNQITIVGATSPRTLFFSTPNDLSSVSGKVIFGHDKPFDNELMPLYKRDIEYHKFLHLLMKSEPNFATWFPEMTAYLNACYSMSDESRRAVLSSLQPTDINNYNPVAVGGNAGNLVEFLPDLRMMQPNAVGKADPENQSDFVINSGINKTGYKPLVLPIGTFNQNLQYVNSSWQSETKVPIKDDQDWRTRKLPNSIVKYPYLTISDFLEDTIYESQYKFNSDNYYNGFVRTQTDTNDKGNYLLPIKPLFFEFFTSAELRSVVSQGKKMFEIEDNANDVKVTLRIPIKKGYIEYVRHYFKGFDKDEVDAEHNTGKVVTLDRNVIFAMMPPIVCNDAKENSYRLALLSQPLIDNSKYTVRCYDGGKEVENLQLVNRSGEPAKTYRHLDIYVLNGAKFDYIRLGIDNGAGVIMPIFASPVGTDSFSFSVDFGTTNTHVEYRKNGDQPKPLDIVESDKQICWLCDYERAAFAFDSDLIPLTIGNDSLFSFPMRTVLSYGKNLDWNCNVDPMSGANIPFAYGRRGLYEYNNYETDLKWSNGADNAKKVKNYIANLLWIMRNKVLLNGGDLLKTKVVWFYPISMTNARFSMLNSAWQGLFKEYFGVEPNDANLMPMTESVAPYQYYKSTEAGSADVVSIDVGGGTSDVVFANRDGVQNITSFRFAANSIFGDAYHGVCSNLNGIIDYYVKEINDKQLLSTLSESKQVFETIINTGRSVDLASFLFSLKGNKDVVEAKMSEALDLNSKLQLNDRFKIIFVIFYSAIIYYVAHIMKCKNMRMPRYITFSGNGSKVIDILSPDMNILAKFTKVIFNEVYGKDQYGNDDLKILHDQVAPKAATCKGGLSNPVRQEYDAISEMKIVFDGKDIVSGITYKDIKDNDKYINDTVSNVKEFFDFTFKLNEKFSFKEYFSISGDLLEVAKGVCGKDLETFAYSGLNNKYKEVEDSDKLEETMFFYPIVGVLNALASELNN